MRSFGGALFGWLKPSRPNAISCAVARNFLIRGGETEKARPAYRRRPDMPPFMYRCPNTRHLVQAYTAEEVTEDTNTFKSVTCLACRRIHLVNAATGKVAGEEDE